jgi:hypothetical protein
VNAISTERLRLVPVDAGNADVLWGMLGRGDLRVYQDLPDVDRAHFRRIVEARPKHLEPGALGRFEWLIYERVGEDAAASALQPQASGWVSLRVQERGGRAEVGYSVIGERRRKGIATESLRALVREGFERGDLTEIRAYCVPENRPSRNVLLNAGFSEGGLVPRGATVRGRSVDVLAFVLSRAAILSER